MVKQAAAEAAQEANTAREEIKATLSTIKLLEDEWYQLMALKKETNRKPDSKRIENTAGAVHRKRDS